MSVLLTVVFDLLPRKGLLPQAVGLFAEILSPAITKSWAGQGGMALLSQRFDQATVQYLQGLAQECTRETDGRHRHRP